MSKTFTHPDLLLTVKGNVLSNHEENLDSSMYEDAKNDGKNLAVNILNKLFNKIEYGKIESDFNTERLNSSNFKNIREQIIKLHFQRETVGTEAIKYSKSLDFLSQELNKTQKSFFRFLFKKKIQRLTYEVEQNRNDLDAIKEVEKESYLNITYEYSSIKLKEKYSDLISAFTTLKGSSKIWDMTYSERNMETKSAAQTSMSRNEVEFSFNSIKGLQTNEKSFQFENFNGGDFYFYPNFVIYFKTKEDIAILDYNDLQLDYSVSRFLEESQDIPADTKIVGETWYRVNKDGSPDKRFVNNYTIPIVEYGSIHLKTESGVNELYYISDIQKANHFSEQYNFYQELLKNS
ncbi:hypothetical protein [Flavobacterium reichenbachii]|uniref:Uncharacterized protein n=1 Tax=Flavobacterium reichenbachii TaxID=362418 RepID=A0A085ZNT7_9FLAO|nr:hypothetical protein [Flavobacterium reichenbachii]KFF06101.1 hypothetical protein IW19_11430 [Flavobacterium reichenbachii]OXB14675.1 hypothetical protein B0A68_11515 [Flavobacterium reichenbachii]